MTGTKTTTPIIRATVEGQIGYLHFNNPGKYNALPQVAWQKIPQTIQTLSADGARVIIVCGDGGNFCAGADISEFDVVRKNSQTALIYEQSNIDAFDAIRNAPVPTIAKINGWCLGGGFGLASACDFRIANPEAQFGVPAARLGLAYPVSAMADIVHSVGEQNAKRLLFTGQKFDAKTMLSWGFLSEVVENWELDERVAAIADEVSNLAPLTHKATKAAISAVRSGDTKIADELGSSTFTSEDYAEGRAAFQEKRSPVFQGR